MYYRYNRQRCGEDSSAVKLCMFTTPCGVLSSTVMRRGRGLLVWRRGQEKVDRRFLVTSSQR